MTKFKTFLLSCFLTPLSWLPLKCLYGLGRFCAWFARSVMHYRVDVVTVNLSRSFPNLKYWQIKDLSRKFYAHFGDIIAETIWFGGCRKPERLVRQRLCDIENPEVINEAFRNSPGVVAMYSHCGNWEILGGLFSYDDCGDVKLEFKPSDYCVVYRKMSSAAWDEILRRNRFAPLEEEFDGYLETNSLIRYVIGHKDEKRIYNINTDQHPYIQAKGTLPVTFMNQRCETMAAAANIAAKFGFAVVYQCMDKDRRGHYTIRYTRICDDASKMPVQEIMDRFYELLQKDIEANPANYLWTHKRWK